MSVSEFIEEVRCASFTGIKFYQLYQFLRHHKLGVLLIVFVCIQVIGLIFFEDEE